MISSEKSYGKAMLFLVFGSLVGAHKIYLKESIAPLFYYWFLLCITCSGIFWWDLFTMKSKVLEANLMYRAVFKND